MMMIMLVSLTTIIVTEESAEVTYVENYLSTASGEGNHQILFQKLLPVLIQISLMAQLTI